jgi:adenylate kinase
MGAPGSGKGTQSRALTETLKIPAVSTGEMLRAAIAGGSETGKQAQLYINDGKLVPDGVIIDIVLHRLGRKDCENGYILDGFPRTAAQAEAMAASGMEIDAALFIDASDEVVTRRICGRRVCGCGAIYHTEFKPPRKDGVCDVCGSTLTVRDDDKPETIAERLRVYHEQTAPVIAYYREKGKLISVTSRDDVEETTKAVLDALNRG